MKKINVVSIISKDDTGVDKIWIGNSFIWKDEEQECKYFKNLDGTGCINYCIGNEPYSCHRSKKENLCHKKKG